jgi:DNA-binding NarL/FixJ family response regulator
MDAVLVIDDNRDDGLAIAEMLAGDYSVMTTDCASSAAELGKQRFDFAIIMAANDKAQWRDALDHITKKHRAVISIAVGDPHIGDAAMQAINRGAQYFIAQPVTIEDILTAFAILRARHGRKGTASPDAAADQSVPAVTMRERVVIDQVIAGHSNQDIADALGTSEQYVKNVLHRIYRRHRIKNRVALIRLFSKAQDE